MEARIFDKLILEFAEINKDEITTSDLQGIAIVKAMEIIKIVKRD